VKSYRLCKQQHYFRYVERITSKKVKRPFQFGRIVHSIIEAHANGEDEPVAFVLDNFDLKQLKVFEAEREMYGDILNDIRIIMTDYFDYWPDDSFLFSRYKGQAAEFRFDLDMGEFMVVGVIDTVGKAKSLRWLGEHKTFTRAPNDDERWRNVQGSVYIHVAQTLGWFGRIDGIMWNYIHSKPAPDPKMTDGGKWSLAQKSLTLPAKVREFAERNGYDMTPELQKLIEVSGAKREDYFRRVFMPVPRMVVDNVWQDFMVTARDIVHEGHRKEKTIGRHCSWCDYEPLCRAELQGSDVEFVKERQYIEKADEEDSVSRAESDGD
jgi:hypothetical protein